MRCCVFFFYCFFLRRKAQFGMQHPMLPGAWGEQPHKINPSHPKTSASFSKSNRLCFIKQSLLDFMPARASFGIKRPAFTWGHGGLHRPHIRRRFANVRKSCAERTMGVALPLPGCGGGISPHFQKPLRQFSKHSKLFFKREFPLFQFEKGRDTLKECNNGTRKMLRMPFISGSFQATQTGMRSGIITQRKGTPSLLRTAGPEPSLSSNVISSVSRLVMQSMM